VAKKRDIRQIEAVARMYGLAPKDFGDHIEDCKAHGDCGTLNDKGDFTWDESCAKAEEFKGQ
jgi:hypothetical protein